MTRLCDYVPMPDVSVFDAATWDGFDVDAWRSKTGEDKGPGVVVTCRGCGESGYAVGQSRDAIRHALGDVKKYCACEYENKGDAIYSVGDGADGHFCWPEAVRKRARYVTWE